MERVLCDSSMGSELGDAWGVMRREGDMMRRLGCVYEAARGGAT